MLRKMFSNKSTHLLRTGCAEGQKAAAHAKTPGVPDAMSVNRRWQACNARSLMFLKWNFESVSSTKTSGPFVRNLRFILVGALAACPFLMVFRSLSHNSKALLAMGDKTMAKVKEVIRLKELIGFCKNSSPRAFRRLCKR